MLRSPFASAQEAQLLGCEKFAGMKEEVGVWTNGRQVLVGRTGTGTCLLHNYCCGTDSEPPTCIVGRCQFMFLRSYQLMPGLHRRVRIVCNAAVQTVQQMLTRTNHDDNLCFRFCFVWCPSTASCTS